MAEEEKDEKIMDGDKQQLETKPASELKDNFCELKEIEDEEDDQEKENTISKNENEINYEKKKKKKKTMKKLKKKMKRKIVRVRSPEKSFSQMAIDV